MDIKITKFGDSRSLLGKKVSLSDTDTLIKESVVSFSQGFFESIPSTWDEFGSVLTSLKPNETLGMGVCCKQFPHDPEPISRGKIVTAKREHLLKEGGCARTLANFTWHKKPCAYVNVLMVDIDEAVESIEEALDRFFTLFPEMGALPGGHWVMASAGAYIKRTGGEWLTKLSGMHIYFAIPNTIEINDIKRYLRVQSWLAEAGRFDVSTHKFGHTLLERHFIDMSVFSPERLDFIGGSECGEGLQQERPAPVWYESPEADRMPNFDISDDEEMLSTHLRSEAKFSKEGKLPPIDVDPSLAQYTDFVAAGKLPGTFPLSFDSGTNVPVWEVIAAPDSFHGQTLSDPLFPEKGRCKAKYYYNGTSDGLARHVVNSFVKGGQQFFLTLDLSGALEMIHRLGEAELKQRFHANGSGWEDVMTLDIETELPVVLEALKLRGIGKITELKAHMGKAVSTNLLAGKREVLEQFNDRFAYVDVGSKPRILEDTGNRLLLRTRQDFLTAVEHIQIPKWTRGGVSSGSAGEEWLKWNEKRMYGGIEFDPSIAAREFERDGLKIYNRFRGFSVQPVDTRACGMKHCKGQGCLKWFFGEDGYKVCKGGSWTYWLMTILDVLADGNRPHARWVVDWLVDMVKNPAGGSNRAGTSLVVRGGQGTGKGSIIWPIFQILAPHAFQCDSMDEVTNNFNSFMEDTILLFADEAVWGGSKKESGKLKRMITEDTLNIEPKGLDRYQVVNHLRLYISSNSEWVVPAEDDERRYTVFDATDAHRLDHDWFGKMKGANLGELLDEIQNWEITSDIKHNLDTLALNEQKQRGWSVYEEFLADSLDSLRYWDDNLRPMDVSNAEIEQMFMESYTQHRDSYGLTGRMFTRRLRKILRSTDALVPPATKVLVNGMWEYGFTYPSFSGLCKLLRISIVTKKRELGIYGKEG